MQSNMKYNVVAGRNMFNEIYGIVEQQYNKTIPKELREQLKDNNYTERIIEYLQYKPIPYDELDSIAKAAAGNDDDKKEKFLLILMCLYSKGSDIGTLRQAKLENYPAVTLEEHNAAVSWFQENTAAMGASHAAALEKQIAHWRDIACAHYICVGLQIANPQIMELFGIAYHKAKGNQEKLFKFWTTQMASYNSGIPIDSLEQSLPQTIENTYNFHQEQLNTPTFREMFGSIFDELRKVCERLDINIEIALQPGINLGIEIFEEYKRLFCQDTSKQTEATSIYSSLIQVFNAESTLRITQLYGLALKIDPLHPEEVCAIFCYLLNRSPDQAQFLREILKVNQEQIRDIKIPEENLKHQIQQNTHIIRSINGAIEFLQKQEIIKFAFDIKHPIQQEVKEEIVSNNTQQISAEKPSTWANFTRSPSKEEEKRQGL